VANLERARSIWPDLYIAETLRALFHAGPRPDQCNAWTLLLSGFGGQDRKGTRRRRRLRASVGKQEATSNSVECVGLFTGWAEFTERFVPVASKRSESKVRGHDQYATIVRSKPGQMVLNHPKSRRPVVWNQRISLRRLALLVPLQGGPEKAGGGGSIPSLATTLNQWLTLK
jgi:hypothetical protein